MAAGRRPCSGRDAGVIALLLAACGGCSSYSQPAASRPSVFSDAAVNVVVLPYEAVKGAPESFSGYTAAAEQLSYLVQLQIFAAVLKYQEAATVRIASQPLDPSLVVEQLLGKTSGAAHQLARGRGLVLVSGKIFEEGDSIYVRSVVRFLRRDRAEDFTLSVGTVSFQAELPFTSLTFAGRRLQRDDFQAIKADFERAAVVHLEPNEDAPSIPMPLDPHSKFWYQVTATKKGWMRIAGHAGGPSGWVQTKAATDRWSLEQQMPELSFVEGVVGYLCLRVGGEAVELRPVGGAGKWAKAALDRFDGMTKGEGSNEPRAASAALQGAIAWLTGDKRQALRGAAESFDRAASMAPSNVGALNLALTAHLYGAYHGALPGVHVREVADGLFRTAGLDPSNSLALGNLRSLYKLLATTGAPRDEDRTFHLGSQEIKRRNALLVAVQ